MFAGNTEFQTKYLLLDIITGQTGTVRMETCDLVTASKKQSLRTKSVLRRGGCFLIPWFVKGLCLLKSVEPVFDFR